MKYKPLNKSNKKHQGIRLFDGGIDLSKAPSHISDNCISEGENIMFDSKSLKTRSGLFTDDSRVISSDYTADADFIKHELSEGVFYIDGMSFKIALEYSEYIFSDHKVSIFLIGEDIIPIYTGSLSYKRISDDIFYIPTNITFFQGKSQSGGGIFALVSLNNSEDYTDSYFEIYEISSSYYGWDKVQNFYIPTVYINGRGDSYEKAKVANQANQDSPKTLEAPNMLTGEFYAYYSSDGYSSSFRLPFCELQYSPVICRIYTSPTEYTEWNILADSQTDKQSILGNEVTAHIDRSKGIIYFTVASGDFSIPLMSRYKENNIKITASKPIGETFNDVISCKNSVTLNSRIILSGGIKNNRIYSSRYENPLYFPLTEIYEIGDARTPVTALKTLKNKIVAFKENESYILDLKKGKAINKTSLLADNSAVFYGNDSFSVSLLNPQTGVLGKNSVAELKESIILYANDGNIYSISATERLSLISQKIRAILKKIPSYMRESVRVVCNDSYALFLIENYSVAAFFGDESDTNWYIWKFPEEVTFSGGYSHNSVPIFLCKTTDNVGYFSTLSGKEDTVLENSTLKTQIHNIESLVTTKHFSINGLNSQNRLLRLDLQVSALGNTRIFINDNEEIALVESEKERKITIFPKTGIFNSFYIKVVSDTYFELGETDITYE